MRSECLISPWEDTSLLLSFQHHSCAKLFKRYLPLYWVISALKISWNFFTLSSICPIILDLWYRREDWCSKEGSSSSSTAKKVVAKDIGCPFDRLCGFLLYQEGPFFIIGADKQCVTLSLVPPLAFTSGKVNKKLPEDTLFKLAGKLKWHSQQRAPLLCYTMSCLAFFVPLQLSSQPAQQPTTTTQLLSVFYNSFFCWVRLYRLGFCCVRDRS